MAAFWTSEELDFSVDKQNWSKLTKNEQHFIKYILAFFAGADAIVVENLNERFILDVNRLGITSATCFYGFQTAMENIHAETYAIMIETLISKDSEKKRLKNAINTIPVIGEKAKWAKKWIASDAPFAERLVAFAAVEGIFFSGAFCSIFWLKTQNKPLHGLFQANEFIARDEGLHTDFACALYNGHIKEKCSDKRIHEIFDEAVEIETKFIVESLPCSLIMMNQKAMIKYIKYVTNRLLKQLKHKILYTDIGDDCPFPFMSRNTIERNTNFHDKKVSEYSMANKSKGSDKFVPLDDF